MSELRFAASVEPGEWDLLRRLRDVPQGAIRTQMFSLLAELLDFADDPGCAEKQADGVPCASAHSSCEDCQRIATSVGRLRAMLRAVPEP